MYETNRRLGRRNWRGFTLIELLCVISIVTILVALSLGPAGRILKKVRADQWENRAGADLDLTVQQLRRHFEGKTGFPRVTLERIATEQLVGPSQLRFLRDRRVTYIPFCGADPDDLVVIMVRIDRGFWTEPGLMTEAKGTITTPK